MKTTTTLVAALALASVASCSDPGNVADARIDTNFHDGPNRDAPIVPAAPTIGAQIDRMGRPAVNTALNALINPVAADVTTMKDNYNHATAAATWASTSLFTAKTIESEFKVNLAVLDVIDQGLTLPAAGCGNQLLFNGVAAGGGAPTATSYMTLADILADDELFVDTSKLTCTRYLSLEADVATGGTVAHTDCGGRAPSYDVMDATYSILAAGVNGLSTDGKLTPLVTDGGGATKVTVHLDTSDLAFPYLGPPTNP